MIRNRFVAVKHIACISSSAKHRRPITELLIRHGAFVNVLNTLYIIIMLNTIDFASHSHICIRHIAPIHLCAATGHDDLLEILIKNNADVCIDYSYFFFEINV